MTTDHNNIKKWIRDNFLYEKYNRKFANKKLLLQSRGTFEFDAVSEDEDIIGIICVLAGLTSEKKTDTVNIQKVRTDAFWLMSLEAYPSERLFIFTDQAMFDIIKAEIKKKKFPSEIAIMFVELPDELKAV